MDLVSAKSFYGTQALDEDITDVILGFKISGEKYKWGQLACPD